MQSKEDLLKELGAKIRDARNALGITTKEVASDLKISLSTITSIERGERTGKNWIKYVHYLKTKNANINFVFEINKKSE